MAFTFEQGHAMLMDVMVLEGKEDEIMTLDCRHGIFLTTLMK